MGRIKYKKDKYQLQKPLAKIKYLKHKHDTNIWEESWWKLEAPER